MISKNRLFLLITFILSGCKNTTKIEVSKKLSDFDNCRPDSDGQFHDGLTVVYSRKDGKLGCINKNGKIETPCKYDYIRGLEEGLSLIENQKGEYGYINRDGKIAIELKYKNARDFHEGLGGVENNKGKWGYCGFVKKID